MARLASPQSGSLSPTQPIDLLRHPASETSVPSNGMLIKIDNVMDVMHNEALDCSRSRELPIVGRRPPAPPLQRRSSPREAACPSMKARPAITYEVVDMAVIGNRLIELGAALQLHLDSNPFR